MVCGKLTKGFDCRDEAEHWRSLAVEYGVVKSDVLGCRTSYDEVRVQNPCDTAPVPRRFSHVRDEPEPTLIAQRTPPIYVGGSLVSGSLRPSLLERGSTGWPAWGPTGVPTTPEVISE